MLQVKSKLFRRQFVAMFLFAVVIAGILSLVIILRTRVDVQNRELQIASAYRDAVLSSLERWLDERVYEVKSVAGDTESDLESGGSLAELSDRFQRLTGAGSIYTDFFLVDPGGFVVASKAATITQEINLADRDYIRMAFAGRAYVSGIFSGRKAGLDIIALAEPVAVGEQRYALAGIVSLADLLSIVDSLNFAHLGTAFLLSRDGMILSSPLQSGTETGPSRQHAGLEIKGGALDFIRTGVAGARLYTDSRGEKVTGAWEYIQRLNLVLLVEMDNQQAMKPLFELLHFGALVFVIAILLLIITTYLLTAGLLLPVSTLIEAVNELKNDSRHSPIEISTGTELDDLIAAFNDMSAAVTNREASLRDTASRDSLTGLYNHGKLDELLAREFRLKRRNGELVCFVMLDIDHFKLINDTYGHQTGDRALQFLSKLMTVELREGDILSRYGGEEFAIILDAKGVEEARSFCERIRQAVQMSSFEFDGKKIRMTVSVGFVCVQANSSEPFEIVRNADRALYDAKKAGRNTIRMA